MYLKQRFNSKTLSDAQQSFFTNNNMVQAIERRDTQLVKKYLDSGMSPNNPGVINRTLPNYHKSFLMRACELGDLDIVKMLIQAGAKIEYKTQWGNNALHFASENGSYAVVKYLIKCEAKLDSVLPNGRNALILACLNGHDRVAELLIHSGIDLNVRDQDGQTALMIALKKNSPVAKLLLQSKVEINYSNSLGMTPCIMASQQGDTDSVESLIHLGADVNIKVPSGENALVFAVKKNYNEVYILIAAKIDLNAIDQQGKNSLMIAIHNGNMALAEKLSDLEIDLNHRDLKGKSALMVAIDHGYTELAEKLIQKKVGLSFKDNTGKTAQHYAIKYGYHDLIKLMINSSNSNTKQPIALSEIPERKLLDDKLLQSRWHNYNPNQLNDLDGEGNTLLMRVINSKTDIDIALLLIQLKVDLNHKNKQWKTALSLAIEKNSLKIAQALIDQKVNLEQKINLKGETALLLACRNNNKEILQMLIEAGVNLRWKNKFGQTARDIAVKEKRTDIVILIDKYLGN